LTVLAGRKLLLADDSVTIQKVVDLTFTDEGVEVVSVPNGKQALEKLEEVAPDIVLADVHMPEMNGYQVCEYIKKNEKLRHIPVMLLVGSFEPFDEAEARRVGANDTLSKPFQSIRRLVDRVGSLLGSKPADDNLQLPVEEEAQTAELPTPMASPPEVETLSTEELKVTTADTLPLTKEARTTADLPADLGQPAAANNFVASEPRSNGRNMESSFTELKTETPATSEAGEVLLDLGDLDSSNQILCDEFVLDLDMEMSSDAPPLREAIAPAEEVAEAGVQWGSANEGIEMDYYQDDAAAEVQLTNSAEHPADVAAGETAQAPVSETRVSHTLASNRTAVEGQITLDQLAPEVIDAIARRAVEHLSHKVVEEIAWEVVPELSELLIKHQLEKARG